jgi:hypothetical protein
VQDFETPDNQIPFSTVILSLPDGNDIVLDPAASTDQQLGRTTFDPAGPDGKGDKLNYKFTWTVPATLDVRDNVTGGITQRSPIGQSATVIAIYLDDSTPNIMGIDFATTTIDIEAP